MSAVRPGSGTIRADATPRSRRHALVAAGTALGGTAALTFALLR